jgi:sulfur-oxidizing protein SoxX
MFMGFMTGCTSSDRMDTPLASAGDPARGREVFVSRDAGHCVLCHAAPGVTTAGDVGPSLAGIGARLSAAQLRLRVADITRVNPDAAMPAFHRTGGLNRVASLHAGKPALSGQQVEDVVAWLGTLR